MTQTAQKSAPKAAQRSTQKADRKSAARTAPHAPFEASETFGKHLQQLLADLIDLQVQAKHLHWNVVGKGFRSLHLQLDEIVVAARNFGDDVAERMRAVHLVPDGRSSTVAAQTSLPPLPAEEIDTAEVVDLATGALYAVSATVRRIHDDIDEEDPTTADLLHQVIEQLEQFAWFVDSENRVASRSIPRPSSD